MDKWTRSEPKGHPASLIIEQKQETTWNWLIEKWIREPEG